MNFKTKHLLPAFFIIVAPGLPMVTYAEVYTTEKITNIFTDNDGRVGMKWNGSPMPGPCAAPDETNNGFVMVPTSASDAQKALALAIYMRERSAIIVTEGCDGKYESVKFLNSEYDDHDDHDDHD